MYELVAIENRVKVMPAVAAKCWEIISFFKEVKYNQKHLHSLKKILLYDNGMDRNSGL